ncbi:hypothetical protein WJX84_007353 [Apatococcus fuscideae]|uniref:Alpha/beta hydrolase fold-3 domain-containing protein n=1 Tax=Apatococcus fuscideae TaxID=2026836 RepID=A0AAW1T113_9CHLO
MAGLDADFKAFLDATSNTSEPRATTAEEQQRRRDLEEKRPGEDAETMGKVVNMEVPGPDGEVPVRIYYPRSFKGEALPVCVYFHGGCWFMGRLDGKDAWLRRLSNVANIIIMSVDYRRAPQSKFPAGLEDCYAATKHAALKGSELSMDPKRLAVGGDSCGGNLSAAVSLLARDRGEFTIALQLLLCPMTDHYLPGTDSLRDNAEDYGYDAWLNKMGWDAYGATTPPHGSPEQPHTLAAVLRHTDVSGVPPALVVLGQYDIVHDEGLKYAEKLAAVNVLRGLDTATPVSDTTF